MSTKVTQKISDLLKVLIILLVYCAVVITYGITTRPNPFVKNTTPEAEELAENLVESSRSISEYDITQLPVELKLIQPEEEPELVLEGAALYDSYIYDITTTIYPDIDPELVRALVYNESRYDPSQINARTGVVGLAQINPKWHTARAQRLGVEDLSDPYGNLLVCCDILHELYQRYPRNYSLDVYAGGYAYANSYSKSTSPYVQKINDTIVGLRNGSIIPGGG